MSTSTVEDDADPRFPSEALQDALGVTASGTCLRHPNCPVLRASSIMSCRVCFSEEKSAGILQRKSFAAVVHQLQRMSTGNTEDTGDAEEEAPDSSSEWPALQQPQNLESIMKRLSQVQNWMLRQKEKEVLSLQLNIHRLEQRLKETASEVEEQKETIRALRRTIQQDLKIIKTMATQKERELEEKSQGSASSPGPKPKSARQRGSLLGEDEAEIDDEDEEAEEKMLYESPIKSPVKKSMDERISIPQRSTSINARKTPSRTSSSPNKAHRSPPTKSPVKPSLSATMDPFHRRPSGQPFDPLNMAKNARTHSPKRRADSDDSDDDSQPNDIFVPPQRSEYWSDSDLSFANDPGKIFASFRGGLLDIPKSPPPNCHNQAKPKLKLKVKGFGDQMTLKVPSMRGLNRTSSEMTDATGDTAFCGEYDSNNIPLSLLTHHLNTLPFESQPNTPVSIDGSSTHSIHYQQQQKLLQAHREKQEMKKNGQEPPPPPLSLLAGLSPSTKGSGQSSSGPMVPLPTEVEIRDLGSSHQRGGDVSVVTATYSVDTIETKQTVESTVPSTPAQESTEKTRMLFSVSRAACQDKYGDPGIYTGTILVTEGLPHGKGSMNYESGRVYDGEWLSGHWNGRGSLLNPNGDTYEGEFVFDARHGYGVYKWDNGDVYEGIFSQDKRHGQGKFNFHNGNRYEGEFCDGQFEGYGTYWFGGGSYEGEWKQGKYEGAGELKYANGGGYTGEFRNSVAHGFGVEVTADGKKRRGVWENGEPAEYYERK